MSEYWKSTPKYWCKHCKTFVVDTKLARTQHDATGKHQGALNRFLRDLHRNNERESATKEAAKREVERLNAVVSGKPLPATSTGGGGGPSTKWATSAVRPVSEAEQKAQLKQLESLGVALPEEFRKEVALPGEWTSLSVDPTTTTSSEGGGQKRGTLSSKGKQAEQDSKEAAKEEILRKRKADEEAKRWEEMDEDERAMRRFKVEAKTYPGDTYGGDDDEELNALLGTGKEKGKGVPVKKEEPPKHEVTEDGGKVIKKEEDPDVQTTPFSTGAQGDAVVKQEEGVEKKLGDGIAFKKRKVGNLRKK